MKYVLFCILVGASDFFHDGYTEKSMNVPMGIRKPELNYRVKQRLEKRLKQRIKQRVKQQDTRSFKTYQKKFQPQSAKYSKKYIPDYSFFIQIASQIVDFPKLLLQHFLAVKKSSAYFIDKRIILTAYKIDFTILHFDYSLIF